MAGTTLVALCLATLVTAYAPSAGGLNCDASDCLTATGETPRREIAACGPGWPTGVWLDVPGYGMVRCGDRFGRPPHEYAVDVFMDTRQEALVWGVQPMTVCAVARGPKAVKPLLAF